MATYKYRQYINSVNDSVDVVVTENGVEITKNIPMNTENTDYAEILRQVDAGTITIEDAD